MNTGKKALSNYYENYFTEEKRQRLAQLLAKFDEKSRSVLI